MNYIPRQAAIVAKTAAEADFAASTISSYGIQVSRYDSTQSLTRQLERQASGNDQSPSDSPDIAIVAGSGSSLTNGTLTDVGHLANLVPVVITSSATSVSQAVELMKQGASDVVELPCDREQFWQRFSKTLEHADAEAARKAQMAEMRSRLELLTAAENEVVDAMLDGLANKQIAQRLGIGLRTVELRRSKIMRKMQAKSVAELVKFICMAGRLRPEHPAVA